MSITTEFGKALEAHNLDKIVYLSKFFDKLVIAKFFNTRTMTVYDNSGSIYSTGLHFLSDEDIDEMKARMDNLEIQVLTIEGNP